MTFSITTAQQRTISVHLPPTASFADLEDAVAAELNICPTPGARVDVEEDADTVAAAEQSGGGGGGGGSGPIKLRIKFLNGRTIDLRETSLASMVFLLELRDDVFFWRAVPLNEENI